ncbi:MAG: hypothetical protein NZ455_02020 [Bacteroidia bacterium]|nr:hypothetical protein [Bacteroidia bacterium]MDW8346546.1 hypothetical protein [Bacteroidia bacterium]
MGGWGVAPLARSTPTRAQRGTRPKIIKHNSTKSPIKLNTTSDLL